MVARAYFRSVSVDHRDDLSGFGSIFRTGEAGPNNRDAHCGTRSRTATFPAILVANKPIHSAKRQNGGREGKQFRSTRTR